MNLKKYIYNNHWTIGFINASLDEIINSDNWSINWVKNPYQNRWFADPFILDVDDNNIYVLVEEYFDLISRGRISKLTIDRKKNKIKAIDVVLELTTHLSFPSIIRSGERIFIYPENGEGSTLKLYEYMPQTNECVFLETLSKEPLADGIITDLWGERLLFATCSPNHNGNILNVYQQIHDRLFEFKESITFKSNIARNAGDYFELNGKYYRAAQDCSKRYGGAVIIQEISRDAGGFHFRDVKRIDCMPSDYTLGLHTFNYHKGMAVLDANGLRRPKLERFVRKIRNCIGR